MSEQDDIRRVIDDTLAKALLQYTAADQARRQAVLEREAAAQWHEKARRAFLFCAIATVANVLALVAQLLLGFRL